MNFRQAKIPLCFLSALLIFLTGCVQSAPQISDTQTNAEENPWDHVEPIPFSGYVCGTENAETLVQVFILGPPEVELSKTQISQSYLSHSTTEEVIPCRLSNLIPGTVSEHWRLYTLTLFVQFPSSGVYWMDQIELNFMTGETVLLNEGAIEIEVLPPVPQNHLVSTRFQMNSESCSLVNITYQNLSNTALKILDIEAGSCYSGVKSIVAAKEGTPVDSTLIPPGEARAFSFEFIPKEDAFQTTESQFFLMLPKLQYQTEEGLIVYAPAQTQATTIHPNLLIEYLDSLYIEQNI